MFRKKWVETYCVVICCQYFENNKIERLLELAKEQDGFIGVTPTVTANNGLILNLHYSDNDKRIKVYTYLSTMNKDEKIMVAVNALKSKIEEKYLKGVNHGN